MSSEFNFLEYLQQPNTPERPYAFSDVVTTVVDNSTKERIDFAIPGVIWSDREDRPSLSAISGAVVQMTGPRNIWVGFKSYKRIEQEKKAKK